MTDSLFILILEIEKIILLRYKKVKALLSNEFIVCHLSMVTLKISLTSWSMLYTPSPKGILVTWTIMDFVNLKDTLVTTKRTRGIR